MTFRRSAQPRSEIVTDPVYNVVHHHLSRVLISICGYAIPYPEEPPDCVSYTSHSPRDVVQCFCSKGGR